MPGSIVFLYALWQRRDKNIEDVRASTSSWNSFHYTMASRALLLPLALACSSTVINDVVTTCWHFTPFIFFQRHSGRRSDPSREAADLDAQEDLRRRRPELHRELARPSDQPDDLGRKRNLLFARRFKVSEQKLLGCGSVGRVVAADTRDLQFESRHRQSFIYLLCNRIDENKGKDGQEWPIFKKATSWSWGPSGVAVVAYRYSVHLVIERLWVRILLDAGPLNSFLSSQ